MSILQMPARTYCAKPFQVFWGSSGGKWQTSGTLDGFIDLATPDKAGTYQLSLAEALALSEALKHAAEDVQNNCLYDKDALLSKR